MRLLLKGWLVFSFLTFLAPLIYAQKGYVLMVIAQEGFRDEELTVPKALFEERGYKVEIASRTLKEAKGMLGLWVKPDLTLNDVDLKKYKAVIFVGGVGTKEYFDDPLAVKLVKETTAKGKILGAICLAPVILARAEVLKGKKATVWPSEAETLRKKGAEYTGKPVEVDGNIVTANGPKAAKAFAEKVLELLER